MTAANDRSPESRAELYAAIERAAAKFPDLRVGQIISNAIARDDDTTCDPFHYEDRKLTARINAWIDRTGGCAGD